jgi:hypothetical protein
MTHVDLDDLAAFVLTPDDGPDDVRLHVESCADCAATAAALSDVRRLVGEEPLVPPAAHVREQVLAQVRASDPADGDGLRAMPLAVGASDPRARRGRRVPAWAAGLAAGVALVAGLALGRLTGAEPEAPEAQPSDPGSVVAAAALTALDSDAARGEASVVRNDDMITLRVSAKELGHEDGFHEVWLINVDGTRMVALGVLAAGDTGEFQVPRGLLDEGYRIVDISVEPDDGDPTHSGVSLARGELA